MITPNPAQLVHELETGAAAWRNLTPRQRRAALTHALTQMAVDDDTLTNRRYDAEKPGWAPQAKRLRDATGKTLGELACAVGVHYTYAHARCDCGRPSTHSVPITTLTAENHRHQQRLRLCDTCHADFVAMESIYG